MQDDDAAADLLDHFEDVRAVDHRLAARGEDADQVAQHHRRGDIETRFGLVEDDDVGIVQQRAGDQHLLAHPLRVAADRLERRVAEAEEIEQCVDPAIEDGLVHFAQAPDELEVLAAREERVEVRLLRHVAQAPAEGHQIGRHWPAP